MSQTSLIWGETAEMPKVYNKDDFDIAGFSVGIIDKKDLLPKKNISNSDCIIGIKSSGFHSNGYSLLNNMLEKNKLKLNEILGNQTLGSQLIKPTKIYTYELYTKYYKRIKDFIYTIIFFICNKSSIWFCLIFIYFNGTFRLCRWSVGKIF